MRNTCLICFSVMVHSHTTALRRHHEELRGDFNGTRKAFGNTTQRRGAGEEGKPAPTSRELPDTRDHGRAQPDAELILLPGGDRDATDPVDRRGDLKDTNE